MSYERTVHASVPKAAAHRLWLAAALLEAPDRNGSPGTWEAIEAVPGATDGEGNPTGVVADTVTTRHARFNPGWYRIQWYDSGQNSQYSQPIQLADDTPAGGSSGW